MASALTNFTVTTGAAVRIINAAGAGQFKVFSMSSQVYLGADVTVTLLTGVPLKLDGDTIQMTAAGEVWAISKDRDTVVRVLSV